MDVPSMLSDFSNMAVSQQDDNKVTRADSVAPGCTAPDTPSATTPTDAAQHEGSTTTKSTPSDPDAATARPRDLSAYIKPGAVDTSRSSRSGSTSSNESDSASPSKVSLTPLKATAAEFVPSPRQPQPDAPEFVPSSAAKQPQAPPSLFQVRQSPRGGSGVFATQNISMGTRIISDPPMLRIPWNHLHLVWGPYCRLSNAQKQEYDTLYFWNNSDLRLEQASQMYLLDPTDTAIEEDDEAELTAEHVRVMGIFAVNNFQMSNGALGIFSNAARLNHSCVPNVHHSYNSDLNKLTVHAVRDIHAGEELLMNYIGTECHFWTRTQRWNYLRSRYGFTCQCEACLDTTGLSDSRHELARALIWGLEQWQKGESPESHLLIPDSGRNALTQAEDIISLLLEQGLLAVELTRAYRLASSIAVDNNLFQKALEYASNEAEVERNIYGKEMDDLRKNGMASELWIKQLYRMIQDQPYKPYKGLAQKIHSITGVYHGVLDEAGPVDKRKKKPKSKNKNRKVNFSPKKKEEASKKSEASMNGEPPKDGATPNEEASKKGQAPKKGQASNKGEAPKKGEASKNGETPENGEVHASTDA